MVTEPIQWLQVAKVNLSLRLFMHRAEGVWGVRGQLHWAGEWQMITINKRFERRTRNGSWPVSENASVFFTVDSCTPITGRGLTQVLQNKLTRLSGGTVRGSSIGRVKRFFSSPKHPDRLWDPPSIPFLGYWSSSTGGNAAEAWS